MKKWPLMLSAVIMIATFLISSSVSFGKPEYTKKEKKGCVTCHVTAKSKDLNETGKCYGEKKDLKSCTK